MDDEHAPNILSIFLLDSFQLNIVGSFFRLMLCMRWDFFSALPFVALRIISHDTVFACLCYPSCVSLRYTHLSRCSFFLRLHCVRHTKTQALILHSITTNFIKWRKSVFVSCKIDKTSWNELIWENRSESSTFSEISCGFAVQNRKLPLKVSSKTLIFSPFSLSIKQKTTSNGYWTFILGRQRLTALLIFSCCWAK